jgi:DNA helicase II / ATP-dependent DNA helicase PcrA
MDVAIPESAKDLLEDLNPPQVEAVLHEKGSLLVLAGAGSGKTRVITRRIGYLVREKGVAPWKILAVTFTNKAAREMKERLEKLLGPVARDLNVSTFHSAAALILRREWETAGVDKNFVIYDESDQLTVARRAVRECGVDPTSVNPREILGKIDQEKNHGRMPDQMKVGQDYRSQIAQKVYRKYQQLLHNAGALDFGDLLLLLVDMFRRSGELRRKYQFRFEHVLVDEFQDTNPVQYELLRLIAPPSSNLVVVGDDDQSIYSWRGAKVDNILGFPTDYPGTKVVKLEQNYRSDQNILDAAHAVISKNTRRMGKKLWSQRPKGEKLFLLIHRDERAEAQEIVRRAQDLKREGITPFEQMAVFYRTNAQSRVIEEAFRLSRVPYSVISGRSFYDRAEIRDAASYLRLMINPRSDADLLRVINTPGRGIGDTTVERVQDAAAAAGVSMFEALAKPEDIPQLNQGAIKRLRAFRELIDGLVALAASAENSTIPATAMLERTGLVSSHREEGSTEGEARAENLKELLTATQEYDKQRALLLAEQGQKPEGAEQSLAVVSGPLQGFLEQVSLVGEADQDAGEGRVSLMTLHAAKGLEYDAVFLTGMEEEIFPTRRATQPEATEEQMSEERRLCYVAFTRAKRRLYVSLAQCRTLFGELKFNPPSRFLADVPRDLFDFAEADVPQPVRAYAPQVRRRPYDRGDDEGPVVDRSYSQEAEFSGGELRGMRVRHEQFGKGVVLAVKGHGPSAKFLVRFDSVGEKTVIPRFLMPA